jgi:hypothetical protein
MNSFLNWNRPALFTRVNKIFIFSCSVKTRVTLPEDFCANTTDMHTEYVIPAFLCVAGLILLADFWPLEAEWNPDQNPDYEDDLEMSEEIRNASQTKNGATTASSM